VGIPRSFFFDDLDQEISAAIDEALAVITKLSAGVREITFPVASDRTVQPLNHTPITPSPLPKPGTLPARDPAPHTRRRQRKRR